MSNGYIECQFHVLIKLKVNDKANSFLLFTHYINKIMFSGFFCMFCPPANFLFLDKHCTFIQQHIIIRVPSKQYSNLTETERREITLVQQKLMRRMNAPRGRHIYSFANIREVSIKIWRKAASDNNRKN